MTLKVDRQELNYVLRILRRKPAIGLGLLIIAFTASMALFPEWLARFPPEETDPDRILLPPNADNWFGTDINGLDVYSRMVWAARIDLAIPVTSTAVAVFIGTMVGAWAGYFSGSTRSQGILSDLLLRATDVVQSFPVFVLALALVAVLGRNIFNLIYVLVILEVPVFLRLARSTVLATREQMFVDAARCSGNSELRLILRHVMPNSLTAPLVNASVVTGSGILLTSGLSYVGAGVPAPTPEWGYMVAAGAPNLITGQWWPAFFPGAYIGIVVLGFALVGDGVREYLDPVNR